MQDFIPLLLFILFLTFLSEFLIYKFARWILRFLLFVIFSLSLIYGKEFIVARFSDFLILFDFLKKMN